MEILKILSIRNIFCKMSKVGIFVFFDFVVYYKDWILKCKGSCYNKRYRVKE